MDLKVEMERGWVGDKGRAEIKLRGTESEVGPGNRPGSR